MDLYKIICGKIRVIENEQNEYIDRKANRDYNCGVLELYEKIICDESDITKEVLGKSLLKLDFLK
ncbi:MAG: hypothetical protein Q7S27_03695 [Nanoarchaeota archaeon]|nr:hypothetical protein [Nanoarchaeota archaeon]